jgi:hypothetical protein
MLAHFLDRLQDHYLWLLGLLFMVEPFLDYTVIRYRDWADHYVSRKLRTRIAITLAILAAFAACFLAFRDEYNLSRAAIGERDEARRQLSTITPTNQQRIIERLSADLTAARAEIDAQRAEIEKLRPKPPRHLTENDKQQLIRAFTPIKDQFPELQISAPGDGEAQGYAKELAATFNDQIGIKVARVGFVIATSPTLANLSVAVKSLDKVPPKAELFAKTMIDAGFTIVGSTFDALADDQFVLVVGPQH